MITVPTQKPATIRTNATDFGTTAAQAIWRDVVRAMNWYNECLPVGIIMSWYQSQQYAVSEIHPMGDTAIPFPHLGWWFCNGSLINAALSPLNGVVSPDFRGRFLKHAAAIAQLGGSATIDLRHYHTTGVTGVTDSPRLDGGGERGAPVNHNHPVGVDLSVMNNIPPYVDLQYYMKINGGASLYSDLSYEKIDDAILTRFGKVLSIELAIAIKSALDYLNSVMQIGSVWPIMTNIPGVTVNPNIFQECNGSPILLPTSPLRGTEAFPRYTPNLTDRYLKFTASLGQVGQPGGVASYDFNHSHGGQTDTANFGGDDADTDDDFYTSYPTHAHTMSGWQAAPTGSVKDMNPPFYTVKYFMKIQ